MDLRKFFFHYGVKVCVFYKKSTEWNFEKNSQNTYLDPVFTRKNFQKILIHKSCEKSELLKKQPKNTTFSHFSTFLKIYELNFFNIPYIKWSSPALRKQKVLGKSIRQILRSRYVLLSHNEKRIFANPCVISCHSPAKILWLLNVFPTIQGLCCEILEQFPSFFVEKEFSPWKHDFEKSLVGVGP